MKIVKQRDVTPEEAPGSNAPFPEEDIEGTTSTPQTVSSQDTTINSPTGHPITEPEQDEEIESPEDQLSIEVTPHHSYRLRKRTNR